MWILDNGIYIGCQYGNAVVLRELFLNSGKSMKGIFPDEARIIVNEPLSALSLPDLFACASMKIVSVQFKAFLEAEKVQAEFYPLEISIGVKKKEMLPPNSFFYMNFIGEKFDCVDREKSVYRSGSKRYVNFPRVDKLVLDEKMIGNTRLFLIEGLGGDFGVSDELAKRMLEKNFRGVRLTRVEDYIRPRF